MQIKSVIEMKEVIDRIHNQSKDIKESAEYQQKRLKRFMKAQRILIHNRLLLKV